jgi:hypothetical protein
MTPQERALIDEAIAAGRVTKCPTGAMATAVQYRWENSGDRKDCLGKLVEVGGNTQSWHAVKHRRRVSDQTNCKEKARKVRNDHIIALFHAGKSRSEIAKQVGGITPRAVSHVLRNAGLSYAERDAA